MPFTVCSSFVVNLLSICPEIPWETERVVFDLQGVTSYYCSTWPQT